MFSCFDICTHRNKIERERYTHEKTINRSILHGHIWADWHLNKTCACTHTYTCAPTCIHAYYIYIHNIYTCYYMLIGARSPWCYCDPYRWQLHQPPAVAALAAEQWPLVWILIAPSQCDTFTNPLLICWWANPWHIPTVLFWMLGWSDKMWS